MVQTLATLMEDPSPDVRRTAALSLGKIAHPNGISAMIKGLRDGDPQVREYSAWGLGQFGTELTDEGAFALIGALGDNVPENKQVAASALGQIEPKEEHVQLLKEVLTIAEVGTRKAVLQVLKDFDTPAAYKLFVKALKDSDPRVRQAAVAGLGELADRKARPLLRKRLRKDSDEGVRTEAAYRLGKLGDKADKRSLKKAVKSDSSSQVQIQAEWALQQIEPTPPN